MSLVWPSAAAQVGTSPWSQVVGLVTHNRPLLFTLNTLVLCLHKVLELLHFSFSPTYPIHIYTLWWVPLQATHAAGRPVNDIFSLNCTVRYECKLVIYSLCLGGMAVRMSACHPPLLCYLMVGEALSVYGPPVPRCGGQVCEHLSLPTHRSLSSSSNVVCIVVLPGFDLISMSQE